jgi:magnesium transporter
MITLHVPVDGKLVSQSATASDGSLPPAVWFDLIEPTHDEIHAVEKALALELPTREDMQEIEVSSRLYEEDGALFLTATIMSKIETDKPETGAISFILTERALITLRHTSPLSFQTCALRLQRQPSPNLTGDFVFISLLESIVDRIADVLERTGSEIEAAAVSVFRAHERRKRNDPLRSTLQQIGRHGTLISSLSESLVSLSRIVAFVSVANTHIHKEHRGHFKTLARDIRSLQEHTTFLSQKINFILDATLGLISIEQNGIVKIFSVAAVMFMPPTMVASIYGMNFEIMPELKWAWGYPMALVLMLLSALIPYLFFRRRGWL